jgi:hypothetical protein
VDIKAIAFDLDGTLLHSSKTFTDRTLDMISTMKKRGLILVIATGRGLEKARKFYETLDLDTPLVCYNGSCVHDIHQSKDLYAMNIEDEIASEIVHQAKNHEIALHAYSNHQLIYEKPYSMANPLDLGSGIIGKVVCFDDIKHKVFNKALYIGNEEKVDAAKQELEKQFPGQLSMTYSWPQYLEIVHAEADKSVGIAKVLAGYRIQASQTMAFGDAENDIGMLRWAGHGVAMENAMKEVKQVTAHHAGSCDEDGVARYIEQYFNL